MKEFDAYFACTTAALPQLDEGNFMQPRLPPQMDLYALTDDVLKKEPMAALPCNLSDGWLGLVGESLEQVLDNGSLQSGQYLPGPLALVLHLLSGKLQSTEFLVDETHLLNCLQEYRLEVALETVRRHTNVQTSSATLETIFSDRLVTVTIAQNE